MIRLSERERSSFSTSAKSIKGEVFMPRFPILETERFELRQITQNDSLDVFQYFSLDEVTRFYDVESFRDIK